MNHRLTEIDCTNFQSVLILGKNQKNERISNGVGKTTIFRAIEYALFNQSHATVLDKVVRDSKKKAVVELDFDLNGEIYRIYRQRTSTGSPDVRLYKKVGDEFVSISGRTPSATDILIRDLIKISHKAFTYSVLFRQADLTGISSVTDAKKRKEILKEPLNLATYTKLEEMAIDQRRPIKRKIDNLEGSVQVIGNPDDDISRAEKDLKEAQEQIQNHQQLIDTANKSINQKRQVVDDLKVSLGQSDIDIHKKVSDQENNIKKLKENAKGNDKRLWGLADLIATKESAIKNVEKVGQEAMANLEKLTSEKGQDVQELQSLYDKVCEDEVKGSELIASAKTHIKIHQKSLPDSDECPTCHQDITPEYRLHMEEEVQAKLQKLKEDLEFYEDALVKCRRKKLKVDELLKSERERVNKIERCESSIETLGKEQRSLREELERLYTDQKETTVKLKDDERQINETIEHLNTLKEAASKSNAPAINQRIFSLNQEISKLQDEIIENNQRISSFSSVHGGLQERIKTRQKDKDKLVELSNELTKAKRELKISQMVVDAFSSHGIPNFIIQTVLNDLQFETNLALKELRPELEVSIDSELNIEYRRNGVLRDYDQLSHGQHVYIALAFKRGLSQIIARRLGLSINTLFFDEVDSHLDEAGVDAFADAIKKWQKNFTIFVITHNNDLKDKFSYAVMVEEGDDGAEGKLVNSW